MPTNLMKQDLLLLNDNNEISAVDFNKKNEIIQDDKHHNIKNDFSDISSIASNSSQAIIAADIPISSKNQINISKRESSSNFEIEVYKIKSPTSYSQLKNSNLSHFKNRSSVNIGNNKSVGRFSAVDLQKSKLFGDYFGNSSNRLSITFGDKFVKNKFDASVETSTSNRSSLNFKSKPTVNFNKKNIYEIYKKNAELTKNQDTQIEFAKFLFDQAKSLQLEENINDINSVHFDKNNNIKDLKNDAIDIILNLSTNKNNPEANYILGTWYEYGLLGFKVNLTKAQQLYSTCAKSEYAAGIDKLGYFTEQKNKNFNKAYKFYKKAAALGDPSSNYRIGIAILHQELKTNTNNYVSSALFYLKRSAYLATSFFPQGAYVMALILMNLYEIHLDVEIDYQGGITLLEKAADLNYNKAQLKLGYIYEHGLYNFNVNPYKSIYYYQLSAFINKDPQAMVSLSGWYLTGAPNELLQPSEKKAFELCELATRIGCSNLNKGYSKAQYAMGYYHEVGVYVQASKDEALRWYKLSSKNGCEEARTKINELTNTNVYMESSSKSENTSKSKNSNIKLQSNHRNKNRGDCIIF